ncbi:MAG: hypothetical protein R3F17_15265 [Planctomycetota bacterium]
MRSSASMVPAEWQQAWNKELAELARLAEARVPGLATGWAIYNRSYPRSPNRGCSPCRGDAYYAPSHLLDREGLQKLNSLKVRLRLRLLAKPC